MSKIISSKAYISYLPENKLAVSFVVDNSYQANVFIRELDNIDKIEVTAKAHKSSRSVQQNSFFWEIVTKISDFLNGEHTQESMNKIYCEILTQANVKRDLIAVLPNAIDILKLSFRAVLQTGQSIISTNDKTHKTAELSTVWVYHGSSTYTVKEMTELLEYALKYASELGVSDSELMMIENEYKESKK